MIKIQNKVIGAIATGSIVNGKFVGVVTANPKNNRVAKIGDLIEVEANKLAARWVEIVG